MARRGNQQRTKNSKKVSQGERFTAKPEEQEKKKDSDEILSNGGSPKSNFCSGNGTITDDHGADRRGNANTAVDEVPNVEEIGVASRTASLEASSSGVGVSLVTDTEQNTATRELNRLLSLLYLRILQILHNLKTSCFSLSELAIEWFLAQGPLFLDMKSKMLVAYDHMKMKLHQAYPVVAKWSLRFCSILLFLVIIWLDSAFRGINSFLHLGTCSFFSTVWFCVFSLIAMAGVSKFLVALAFAVAAALFIGPVFGALILAVFGFVFLWISGSFWSTMLVIVAGGSAFLLNRERVMLLIATLYSFYSAWGYVGWVGVIAALNLSFFSSDILVFLLKKTARMENPSEFSPADDSPAHFAHDRGPGMPSTCGVEAEVTSEEEVLRLLSCSDHYEALGVPRYVDVDATFLKREYRKKAILVHPDKNMGNEKAADAFKILQNAYEVLMDSFKRKTYDDELRKEELLNYFRNLQSSSLKKGREAAFSSHGEGGRDEPLGDSRQVACEKCKGFHLWISTKRPKSRARWCQVCDDFHQAKEGDGWVEQLSQPFFFRLVQKVDPPSAFVCADGKIFEVTEWFICQELRCPANSHKASFHVNTSIISRSSHGGKRPSSSGHRAQHGVTEEEAMDTDELFQWFQNAVRSGKFHGASDNRTANYGGENSQSPKGGGGSSGGGKRRKKGKRQW